jgi:DNA-binding MarR family transcriptional regulator
MGGSVGSKTLTVPQFRVLNRLARVSMSNQQLSAWMGVSAPTMSKIVDNLVVRKLVTRKIESTDRRQVIVECTPIGLGLAQSIRGSVQKKLARKISVLSQRQLSSLETGLLVLKETFL